MKVAYRPPDRDKYLLKDEIESLLSAAKKGRERDYRYLQFMAMTGVRPSESNVIRKMDIYPEEHRVHVKTIKQKMKKKKDGSFEKADDVYRDVDLSEKYAKDLGRWIKKVKPEGVVFPFCRQTAWRIFQRAAKKAGLPSGYTLYGLRHSRCIYLMEWLGESELTYISQQMGHSSLDVTKVYVHCIPSKRKSNVKKLGTFE